MNRRMSVYNRIRKNKLIFNLEKMNILKSIFSPRLYPPSKQLVDSYLKDINFYSKNDIPEIYISTLNEYIIKGENTQEFLLQLVGKLQQSPTIMETTKLFTIIHCFVVERNYNREEISNLEQLEVNFKVKDNEEWFSDFCQTYTTYLMKMPSVADIYRIAQKKHYETQQKQQLTHIFRIINQTRVLFPYITKAVHVIGRYQAVKHTQFRQLYKIISKELVNIYSYLYFLVGHIVKEYRLYSSIDLRCFLKIIPQLELICDKIEDLLVNKYIKGKKVESKLEFKEEYVAEINYYLQYECSDQSL